MAVVLWHCLIESLTFFDLDFFIFRKLRIPAFASPKGEGCLFEGSFYTHPVTGLVRTQTLFQGIRPYGQRQDERDLPFRAFWVPLWQKAVALCGLAWHCTVMGLVLLFFGASPLLKHLQAAFCALRC